MNIRLIGYGAFAAVVVTGLLLIGLSTGVIAPLLGDGYQPGGTDGDGPIDTDYEHTTVTVMDNETGEELGQVEAAIADTRSKRYLGLSATDHLPENRGMLFVHGFSDDHTYVMREMSFGIDIVFIDADRVITTIHEAPEPGPGEDGNDQRYSGEARYVLEVNRGWTTDHGVEVGDEAAFEL
ncbi:MAG: DUF192 domain-containing protein [Natronomonas sp.]